MPAPISRTGPAVTVSAIVLGDRPVVAGAEECRPGLRPCPPSRRCPCGIGCPATTGNPAGRCRTGGRSGSRRRPAPCRASGSAQCGQASSGSTPSRPDAITAIDESRSRRRAGTSNCAATECSAANRTDGIDVVVDQIGDGTDGRRRSRERPGRNGSGPAAAHGVPGTGRRRPAGPAAAARAPATRTAVRAPASTRSDAEVGAEAAVRWRDHRGAATQDGVAGQHGTGRSVAGQQEAHRVVGVPGRGDHRDDNACGFDDLAVQQGRRGDAEARVGGPDRGAGQPGQLGGALGVVVVPVGDQDQFDRTRRRPARPGGRRRRGRGRPRSMTRRRAPDSR